MTVGGTRLSMMPGNKFSACPDCSYKSSKAFTNQCDNDHHICRCKRITKTDFGCRCSIAPYLGGNGRSCQSCNCFLEGHRKWLEYLWKQETATGHKDECAPCDIYRKFHKCSPTDKPCECVCINTHQTHFFCNATDQNVLVAQTAALRYKIRKSKQWLLINLTIFVAVFFGEDTPTILRTIITSINLLNMCYYIQNIAKLYVALTRIGHEKPAYRTRNCLWEKNLPLDLTRCFKCGSEGFFAQYWQNFSNLVSTLRTVRSSPVGRKETEIGMELELKALGDSILRACSDSKTKRKFEDPKYRLPLMKRMKQPVCGPRQLEKYWRNYALACEDEEVRLSIERLPFRPDSTSPLQGNQSLNTRKKGEEPKYHEVVVSPILRCSRYQYSCEPNDHRTPTVSSGSFFDFMKNHDKADHCRSFKWVANLKFWLGEKIKDTVQQFNAANEILVCHGAAYAQIGVSSVSDLLTVFRKNEELCSYTPILAFLTLTDNQSYLVWRYRVLASKPCLTSYCWSSGGDPRRNQTGPNDTEIVLHYFCTCMDMNLPDAPLHPTKKRPFSDHYVTSSDKIQQAAGEIAVFRQWVNPPHFNVFVKGRIYEIPGGASNLFLALSCLLYCIKIYNGGKIGRVSLGRFGLNLLWVLDENRGT